MTTKDIKTKLKELKRVQLYSVADIQYNIYQQNKLLALLPWYHRIFVK